MRGPAVVLVIMVVAVTLAIFVHVHSASALPKPSTAPPSVTPGDKCYHEWRQLVPVESGGEVVAYLCATQLDGCDLQLAPDSSQAKHYRHCESIANGWRAGVEQFDENGFSKGGLVR